MCYLKMTDQSGSLAAGLRYAADVSTAVSSPFRVFLANITKRDGSNSLLQVERVRKSSFSLQSTPVMMVLLLVISLKNVSYE